jgi:circadian clock protein KaiB
MVHSPPAVSSVAEALGSSYRLRLYVAGHAVNSVQARHNLKCICKDYLQGAEVEVIDCMQEPLRALEDGVLVTPTLMKLSPQPACTIVGTLRDLAAVARALGAATEPGGEPAR